MKKLIVTMLSILACGAAYALPVGNPSDASLLCDGIIWEGHCGDPCDPCLTWCDAWSFRAGFYGDYVFNRHMSIDDDNDAGFGEKDINHFELYTNAGFLAFNLWNRFDVFATLGASKVYLKTNEIDFAVGALAANGPFSIETVTDFSWSVGARGTLWQCGCTSLGIEAQYFQTTQDIWGIDSEDDAVLYPDSTLNMKYYEWQVGLGISHRINVFVPYAAVKWAGSKARFDNALITVNSNNYELYDLKNDKLWGYAVGVSLVFCERGSLTVEGRFGDEKAVYANGQIRF